MDCIRDRTQSRAIVVELDKGTKIEDLEQKLTLNDLRFIKSQEIADPRATHKCKERVNQVLAEGERINDSTFKFLTAEPSQKHRKHEIETLLEEYEMQPIVIQQAEILKTMYENSKKIYEQEMTSQNLEEMLDAVDIRILEDEIAWRVEVWKTQVKELLKDQGKDKKWKFSDILKLSSPPREWDISQAEISPVLDLKLKVIEWYTNAKSETPEIFERKLDEYWVEFDDTSSIVIKKEEEKDSRKRKPEEGIKNKRPTKMIKKDEDPTKKEEESSSDSSSSSSSDGSSSSSSSDSDSDSDDSKPKKKELFKEGFEAKQNPYGGQKAWDIKVVGEIDEDMGEYYSDDPLPSDDDSEQNPFDDKPMTLEQRRHQMWASQNETPGHAFATENARKIEENKKFLPDTKETSKHESPDDKESEDSNSDSSDSSEGSQNSNSSNNSKNSNKSNNEGDNDNKAPSVDSVSNPDQELEAKANMQIKREKFKGSVERFVKKIGYGGKRVIQENVTNNFRTLFQDKILAILRKNKFLGSANETLQKRAKQLEKIAFMKKNCQFKDLCRNIELNVREMGTSRLLSHKFLLGKLPVNFLLINHEKFCEKKEKIVKKLITNYQPNKDKVKVKKSDEEEKSKDVKDEEKVTEPAKIQKRDIISVLKNVNERQHSKLKQEMQDRQERIRKTMRAKQKMGFPSGPMPDQMHGGYPPGMHPDQPQYYPMENPPYNQYDDYDPYMDQNMPQYDMYNQGEIKSEYHHPAEMLNYMTAPPDYPVDPRNQPQQMMPHEAQLLPQAKTEEAEEAELENEGEYDPLMNF